MGGILDRFKKVSGNKMKENLIQSQERGFDREEDERLYYPQRDKEKRANVVIRFLPQKDPNKIPFVKVNSHGFIGDDGRWVIENCPRSFKEKCPLCDAQQALWATGLEDKKEIYRKRKIRKNYMCNILVIKDPMNPEKEGQVFIFKFGPAIYNKIMEVVKPKFEGDESLNPFDIFEGADFNLRIMIDPAKKMTTYESSKFKAASPLCNGDENCIENVLEQLYDLDEVFHAGICKSEAELIAKTIPAYEKSIPSFVRELRGQVAFANGNPYSEPQVEEDTENEVVTKAPVSKPAPTMSSVKPSENAGNDLDEFRKLLNDEDETDEVPF